MAKPWEPTDPANLGPVSGWSVDEDGWERNSDGWYTDVTERGDWGSHIKQKMVEALEAEDYEGTLEEMLEAKATAEGFENVADMLARLRIIPRGTHPW